MVFEGPPANNDGFAVPAVIVAIPMWNRTTSLKIRYKIDGFMLEWYWQYYYQVLNTERGRKMMMVAAGCGGICVLCYLASACVCIKVCICARLCPRYCGDKEKPTPKPLEDMDSMDDQSYVLENVNIGPDLAEEMERLKAEGKEKYGVNSMKVENYDHKSPPKPRIVKLSRSPR